jgi:prefoldin alpha subunit
VSMASRPAPPSEEQVQEDLVRLDLYRNQLSSLLQQHQYLAASRSDHLRARETLEGLDRAESHTEILIPLGGETFVRGTPNLNAPILLGMGSGVLAELDRAKVTELLSQRLTQIDKAAQEMENQMRQLEERIGLLSERLESIAREQSRDAGARAGDVGGD